MNTDTGEIVQKDIVDRLPANEQRKFVMLPPEVEAKMQGMNREQRRGFYKKNKKLFRGLSWDEVNYSRTI